MFARAVVLCPDLCVCFQVNYHFKREAQLIGDRFGVPLTFDKSGEVRKWFYKQKDVLNEVEEKRMQLKLYEAGFPLV